MSRTFIRRSNKDLPASQATKVLRLEQMVFELNGYIIRLIAAGAGDPTPHDTDFLEAAEEYKSFLQKGRG